MAKTLELLFVSEQGKNLTISIDNPKEPIDVETVKSSMDTIIAQQVFTSAVGKPASKKGVRVVERNVNDLEM
ncbi:DUF2922 domain-containing protein [Peribacillus alkalitolerans]|uniref:DUF2922 domain-containing protein n=1 Tax=Peribacillus alkalitolerans TaxID=1550385 RepID=UPI0013D11B1B|nr:DUF2922 domain-containing protein [Peribacillus alkalitolerans]